MKTKKMLIANADEPKRKGMMQRFTGRGYDVTTVDNGISCLAELRSSIPDIVILDRNLLWGGSEGVLAVLADSATLADVPVVVTGAPCSWSASLRSTAANSRYDVFN